MGCTEIPLAIGAIESANERYAIDATRTLAKACVDWSDNIEFRHAG